MILLVNFAKSRNVNPDTVTTYIRRHPDLFEGHTQQQGNKLLLDDVAENILDEKYPLPKPIEVIEDTESRQKLIEALERLEKAKDFIQDLKDQYNNLQIEKIKLESDMILIEDKAAGQVKAAEDRISELKELHQESERKLQEHYSDEIRKLREELESERTRKLPLQEAIRRVFKKISK